MPKIGIDLYNISSDPEDLRAALTQLRQDFDSHNHDGSSAKSFETLLLETLRARAISIKKASYSDTTGGIWMGIAGNTAELNIGDSTYYLKWNGTTVEIAGSITGSSINIPSASAPKFSVTAAGAMTAKSYSLIKQYTAGESLTAGHLGCIKNTTAQWGDDNTFNRDTTAVMSRCTYVNSAFADTNYSSTSLPFLGIYDDLGNHCYLYGKIDLSSNPPGLPAWYEVDEVKLRMYVVFTCTGKTVSLYRVTQDWGEDTITWNNVPTNDALVWATSQVCSGDDIPGDKATSGNLSASGVIEFDITHLYRLWSLYVASGGAAGLVNNGFVIKTDGAASSGYAQMGGRTRTGGGTGNQAPYMSIIVTKDNPGSGNTIVSCDGKIYQASNSNYQRVKNIIGVIGQSVSLDATVDIYSLANGSLIPSSVLSVSTGINYYLNNTDGTIGTLTNDIIRSNEWNPKIGVGSSEGLIVDFKNSPLFIRSQVYPGTGILPPSNATMVVIINNATSTQNILYKDRVQAANLGSWASGTAGLLTSTADYVIYWYKQ